MIINKTQLNLQIPALQGAKHWDDQNPREAGQKVRGRGLGVAIVRRNPETGSKVFFVAPRRAVNQGVCDWRVQPVLKPDDVNFILSSEWVDSNELWSLPARIMAIPTQPQQWTESWCPGGQINPCWTHASCIFLSYSPFGGLPVGSLHGGSITVDCWAMTKSG